MAVFLRLFASYFPFIHGSSAKWLGHRESVRPTLGGSFFGATSFLLSLQKCVGCIMLQA